MAPDMIPGRDIPAGSSDAHMRLDVRDATPDDAGAIADILNGIVAARAFTVIDRQFSVEDERTFIRGFPERGIFHVAVNQADGAVVGFQNVEPFAAFTTAFDHVGTIGTYVDLRLRRRGIAGVLFPATFAAAGRKGYAKLFTFVRADNAPALRTYRRHGFRIVGTAERHARIDGRFVDEIVIEKILDSAP
jgi:L-amino acid N-acyltransferase YncA